VGAFDEAQREISALLEEKRNAGDALASYQLAIYLRDKGHFIGQLWRRQMS
jgi:hypothetical protein